MSTSPATAVHVTIAMVPLKWGDALSTILPGGVGLVGLAPYIPTLERWIADVPGAGVGLGVALLMAAAVVGGFLEALTRISWERWWLSRYRADVDPLPMLRKSPQYAELYERGVQSSYKWVTFHANMAWALTFVLISRLHVGPARWSVVTVGLCLAIIVLLRASHVQWTYYVNYQNKIFESPRTADDVEK